MTKIHSCSHSALILSSRSCTSNRTVTKLYYVQVINNKLVEQLQSQLIINNNIRRWLNVRLVLAVAACVQGGVVALFVDSKHLPTLVSPSTTTSQPRLPGSDWQMRTLIIQIGGCYVYYYIFLMRGARRRQEEAARWRSSLFGVGHSDTYY